MRKSICILLLAAGLATVLAEGDGKPNPYRWVRVASNLRDDSEVERIRQIVTTASEHGLNGMTFSAGLDQLDQKTPDYFQRLKQVREICAERKVDIIPSFFSAGYGGSVLSHDKNLAAGLPVRDALFVVSDGKARFVAEPAVKIANGSFENYQQSAIEWFPIEGKPGEVTIDSAEAKEGKASVRFENVGESRRQFVRLSQVLAVQPYRCYRIRCWVKARNMGKSDPFGSGNFLIEVLGGAEKRPLQYQNPRFSPDSGWQQVSLGFNSWGYDRVEIAPKVRGLAGGQLWLDALQVEEVGLVNLLRRPGTPLVVRSDSKGTAYEEGRDLDTFLVVPANSTASASTCRSGSRVVTAQHCVHPTAREAPRVMLNCQASNISRGDPTVLRVGVSHRRSGRRLNFALDGDNTMNHIFLRSIPLLLAVLASPTVRSAELRPIVEFPHPTNVTSTVTVGEILRGQQVQRVDVLLDRAVEFGPVSLHSEMAQMLSLLASPQSASEPPTSLLALEDHGPTIRVALSAGHDLTIRRIHNDCYRFYWDGKTTWFRFGKSSNQAVQRTGASRSAAETNRTPSAAGSRR